MVWLDRTRKTFIASGGSLALDAPHQRLRWRTDKKDVARLVHLDIPQPELVKEHFDHADGNLLHHFVNRLLTSNCCNRN